MSVKDIIPGACARRSSVATRALCGATRLLVAFIALPLLAAPASGQRFLAAQDVPVDGVAVVDTSAGALFEFLLIDLTATADPPPTQTYDAQVVDDEIWVSSGPFVYRYHATRLDFLGALGPFASARGIEVAGDRVWVADGSSLHELGTDGTRLATHAVPEAYDVLHWNGELLVSNQVGDTIDRYDLSGGYLGVFAGPGAPGGLFVPGHLAPRPSNGNLLVAGATRIFEIEPDGTFSGVYQAGPFEQGVVEMPDGRLLVTLLSGSSVFDPSTELGTSIFGAAGHRMRFLSPLGPGDGSSVRFCQSGPNSAGPGATISALGTSSASNSPGRFFLEAIGLPPGAYGLFVYGRHSTQLRFGDGFLCVSPFPPGLIRLPALRTTPDGRAIRHVRYDTLPSIGAITAGSTYAFQLLFRDTGFGLAGFNGSDGVRVTFQP